MAPNVDFEIITLVFVKRIDATDLWVLMSHSYTFTHDFLFGTLGKKRKSEWINN